MTRDGRDTGPGTRYTDDQRELAYQLWAYQTAGNCNEVSRMLAANDPPIDVTSRSVQRWAESDDWAKRRAAEARAIAPDLTLQTVTESRFGLLETTRRMRRVIADERAHPKDVIAAGELLRRIVSTYDASDTPPAQPAPPPTPAIPLPSMPAIRPLTPDEQRETADRLAAQSDDD